MSKSGYSGYHTNLSEYAGGCSSMELLQVLKNSFVRGKKVFIVIDSDVNELKGFKSSSTVNTDPYIFGFETTEAERKIVL